MTVHIGNRPPVRLNRKIQTRLHCDNCKSPLVLVMKANANVVYCERQCTQERENEND